MHYSLPVPLPYKGTNLVDQQALLAPVSSVTLGVGLTQSGPMPRVTVRKGQPLTAPEPEAEGSPHDKKCFHGFGGGTRKTETLATTLGLRM